MMTDLGSARRSRVWRLAVAVFFGTAAFLVTAAVAADPAVAAPAGDGAIHELRTVSGQGWFYTLNATEAQRAVSQFHFRPSATFGALHTTGGPGRQAIHRLRSKTAQSYLLSVSPQEITNPAFVDEGVFGFVDTAPHPGERKLLRFSNHGQWRVLSDAPANIANMQRAGYTVDGPLGWARP